MTNAPSTTLYRNGRVYAAGYPDATAIAVTGDTVAWVGLDATGIALHPGARVVDLDGAFVAPAFVDAHVHLTATGNALTGLDLRSVRSIREATDLLAAHAAAHPDRAVLVGYGWDETRFGGERRPPNGAELEAAAPGRPVYLARIDEHSAVISDTLRARAGLPSAAGGTVVADAHHRARAAVRELTDSADRDRSQRAALDNAAANGIVAVHECGGPDIAGEADFAAALAASHPVAVRGFWGELVADPDAAAATVARTGASGLGGDLFIDGSIGSRTALLTAPYDDLVGADHVSGDTRSADGSARTATGTRYIDRAAATAHVLACTRARISAGFHAIGDGALEIAHAAFAAAVAEFGVPAVASCGHRIEHAEMLTAAQSADLGAWGIGLSVQPLFDRYWGGENGMYVRRLGDRGTRLNDFATYARNAIPLALGSDSPVTATSPWEWVRAAVNHRTPGSGISPRAAFGAATRGGWRAGGRRDGQTGILAPGSPAHFAIWDAAELVVRAPSDAVQRWSTDPRAGVPPLPDLDRPLPRCLATVASGEFIHGDL